MTCYFDAMSEANRAALRRNTGNSYGDVSRPVFTAQASGGLLVNLLRAVAEAVRRMWP